MNTNHDLRTKLYIDGAWCRPLIQEYMTATNPATGEVMGEVAIGQAGDVQRAVAAASGALAVWESRTSFERSQLLHKLADICQERHESLSKSLSQDQGKPYWTEARDEVDALVDYFRMAAEDVVRLEGVIGTSRSPGVNALVQRRALGVVGIITPWNWPYTMAAQFLAPALAAGNTVVWVCAPSTSICSEQLARCVADAGFPPGVFNFLTGHGPVVGDALAGSPDIAALAFVGSSATGQLVSSRAATKKQLLELGSNGPIVVLDDADLDQAVGGVILGGFLNAGQSCTAAERVLVHERIYDQFQERLVSAIAKEVVLGDPFDRRTTMGPLNNEPAAHKMDLHVQDAVDRGAQILTGGRRRPDLGSKLYWEPTVLGDVPRDALAAREETFGPILPLVRVSSFEDAVTVTNEGPEALVAAIYTEDVRKGMAFSRAIKAGGVNINLSSNYFESHLPFGGGARSSSGAGRVGGRFGMEELTELRTIMVKL